MSSSILNLILTLACLALIAISCAEANDSDSQYSNLPPPPLKPDRFTSKQQLKEYLVKLHEYYAIIGRPRFGRSYPSQMFAQKSKPIEFTEDNQSSENPINPVNLIFELFDHNNDNTITREEVIIFFKNIN